jgi:pyruvate,water dikinase
MDYLLFRLGFDRFGQADHQRVGRKAAALGALLAAGFPVPPGVCIPVEVFRRAISPFRAGIRAILAAGPLSDPQRARQAAGEIENLLAGLKLPEGLVGAVEKALANLESSTGQVKGLSLDGRPLAVRSSATAEDRPEASFAGHYHSMLGVSGRDGLAAAILDVWRSFYNPAALAARQAGSQPEGEEGMAVLVQPLLEAECAGVCFSMDPASPLPPERMLVVAAWGLGAGVVDGSLPADTAWLRREDFGVDARRVVEKVQQYRPGEKGDLTLAPVPEEKRRSACLPDEWLARVGQFSLAAERLFGLPQDLEWAIAGVGESPSAGLGLWVLQSRPIASLPPELARVEPFPVTWQAEEDRKRFWLLHRIDGRGNEPLLPLERDFIAVVESTRIDTTRLLGVERNQEMLVRNGRVYFATLPTGLGEADRRVRRQASADLKERLFQHDQTMWDHWGPEIIRAAERLQGFRLEGAPDEALAGHLDEALAVNRRHWMIHPMCDFQPRPAYFEAYQALAGLAGEQAEAAAYRLVEAEETILTRLVDDLYGLAAAARGVRSLEALLRRPSRAGIAGLEDLPEAAGFRSRLENFLNVYGERTGRGWGSEQSIAAPTWAEQPEEVLRLAALYLDPRVRPPAEARQAARRRRDAEVDALCAAGDLQAAAAFRREWAYALRMMKVLEEHNHYIDQLSTGLLRRAALAAADRLVQRGALKSHQDVFYLTFAEILDALRGTTGGSVAEGVARRKAEQAAWVTLNPPGFLGLPDARLPERPPLTDSVEAGDAPVEGMVMGRGASPGQCSGRARVIREWTSHPEVQPGEILVAANAGPLWLPFFPVLGGLVLDGGSLGQHAASTAREYGIPAVVEAQTATRVIPDGAWLEVDGTRGTVTFK